MHLKETTQNIPASHIFKDIVVEKCNLTKNYDLLRAYYAEIGLSVKMISKKRSKLAVSISKAIASDSEVFSIQRFVHFIMKRNTLSKLYICNFIKIIIKQCSEKQMFILSQLRNFLIKVVGRIFIQTFTSRFTRQSIQLLPAS
jgi:hypothetical protein